MNKKSQSRALDKTPTGIAGFDSLTGGGLPSRRTTLLLGGPGSGKTLFALQTLLSGAQRGEPGILVSFNEHPRHLVENGTALGWDLAEWEDKKLVFLDAGLRPGLVQAGHFDLTGLLAGLRAVATELGARHIVFDSLDVLLTLLDDRLAELQEVFRLRDWLLENGFTGLVTANLDSAEPRAAQRQALMQLLADCTIALDFRLNGHTAARHLRVVKYRGSAFLENEFPLLISGAGLEVLLPRAPQISRLTAPAALHPEIEQARKELTARVQALDRFLEIKQAELDFLLEKQAPRAATHDAGRPRASARRPSRGSAKSVAP
jgi:circadian clock protein KaiC